MKQLSGTDNLFLAQETGNQRAHVAGLGIYDPSTAPGGKVRFKDVIEFFTSRLDKSAVFRRRLVRVPFDLDRPYWIDEKNIDVEYHVRHMALPRPGDWRQLMIQVARIHARPLDLSKPAWEAYIIEGVDNVPNLAPGSFALYIKFHHSAIDGQAGAALVGSLHSLTPEIETVSRKLLTKVVDREPTTLELLARMVGSRVDQAVNATKLLGALAPFAFQLGQKQIETMVRGSLGVRVGEDGREAAGVSKKAPPTRFNGPLSPHRVVDAMPLPFGDIQKIREAVPGSTINDVFVSVCGGTLGKYLQAKGELPEISLNALVPMSIHGEAKSGDAGNQIGMAFVPVFSNIADARERLRKVSRGTTKGKNAVNSVGKDLPARIFQTLPSKAVDFAVRHVLLPQFNFTVSNVRGPSLSLYMAGARLHGFMPVSMLLDGMGLNVTGFSYNGTLWVCAVSDRMMMPDPEFFMNCFRESFAEHLALTVRAPEAETRPARRTTRKAVPVAATSKPEGKPAAETKPIRKPAMRRKPPITTAASE